MESTPSTFTLKSSDMRILKDLFQQYSKDNMMKFYEFFLFCLNKMLVSNKSNFGTFLQAFKTVAGDDDKLDIKFFPNLMTIVAKLLMPSKKRPIFALLNDYLGDKTTAVQDRIQKPRTIQSDDTNKRLLYTSIVEIYIKYQEYLTDAFTLYYQTNYGKKRIFLNWRELSLQNKRLSLHNFNKMLREAEIIPALISEDLLSEMASKISVPSTTEEQSFYNERKITRTFIADTDPNGKTVMEGDPGLYYHEFVLLLARVALEVSKDDPNMKKSDSWEIMDDFLSNKLGFELVLKLCSDKEPKIDEELFSKKFIKKMVDFQSKKHEFSSVSEIRPPTPEPVDDEIKLHYDQIKETLEQEPNMGVISDLIKKLNRDLHALPPPPEISQEPEKEREKRMVVIGKQVPKEKNMNQKKPNRMAPRRKKDEKPIKWEGMPGPFPDTLAKRLNDYKKSLEDEKHFFRLNTGTLSDIEIDPVILKEIIYPSHPPTQEITMLIEAAFNGQSEGRFIFALRNLQHANNLWEMEDSIEYSDLLFFEFMTGLIYESACRDDLALNSFMNCIKHSEKLSYNHPDRALPYMGLGSVLFSNNEYELAARCFFEAMNSRETFLGGNEPDTATCYNNVACCLMKLDRYKEAYDYFHLSELIYSAELGPFHERTLVVKRNKSKCMKGDLSIKIPWKRPYQFYYHDKTGKIGVGGNRKKGKKRRKK